MLNNFYWHTCNKMFWRLLISQFMIAVWRHMMVFRVFKHKALPTFQPHLFFLILALGLQPWEIFQQTSLLSQSYALPMMDNTKIYQREFHYYFNWNWPMTLKVCFIRIENLWEIIAYLKWWFITLLSKPVNKYKIP